MSYTKISRENVSINKGLVWHINCVTSYKTNVMKTRVIKEKKGSSSKSFDKALIHLGIHYPVQAVTVKKA